MPTIFKFKRGSDNTIEFLVSTTKDALSLYSLMDGKTNELVLWHVESLSNNPNIRANLGLDSQWTDTQVLSHLNNRIVECRLTQNTWVLETIRYDKTVPNLLSTAKKTLTNITENLSLLDILPPGSISDEDREAVASWERQHPNWKATLNSTIQNEKQPTMACTDPHDDTISWQEFSTKAQQTTVVTPLAPVSLQKMIQYI
jgi:hypothetical protein